MAVVAYSPIARGGAQGDAVLEKIGKAHGKSAAQVSLRYLVQQDIVVIPRTSKIERLEENIAIFDFELTEAEMAEIAALAQRARQAYRRLAVVAEVGLSGLDTALVLFSGGQDSTVCLAWALERFARVETVGFDYGQRHAVELEVRPRLRERMTALKPEWEARLGDDHRMSSSTRSPRFPTPR